MKPQDLKLPYFWENRCPKIENRVFYVPNYYSQYENFKVPSWQELFANDGPVCCELCSGNGDWVVDQALMNSSINWIAVEKRFDRVRKIWSKMCNHKVENLLIVCGEAQTFFAHYVAAASFQKIIVNFPDPWPKFRHRKHRLFQDAFVQDMVRALVAGGQLTLATDDHNYLVNAIQTMLNYLSPELEAPHNINVKDNYGGSWFENLWRSKGQEIFCTKFVKRVGI